jgi:16S rRNA (guanine1207-N2)-methyltransferase
MAQYFERRPAARGARARFTATLRGHSFTFHTDAAVFARRGIDRGTELLVEALDLGPCELVLDLGCGYGPIGVVASRLSEGGHVILTDVNERAVGLARRNLRENGGTNAEVRLGDLYEPVADLRFDHIACNPPIRAGRAVVDAIIRGAVDRLLDGGRLWLVVRTRQGADAIRGRMLAAFGNADIVRRGSGYKVLRSTKRAAPRAEPTGPTSPSGGPGNPPRSR